MPLTDTQRAHLEKRLQEERGRLRPALDSTLADQSQADEQERAGDLTTMPFHAGDRGTDTFDTELDAANATRISREIEEIDAALDRLYRTPERFGLCEATGRPIPFGRLDLIPWARTCEQAGA